MIMLKIIYPVKRIVILLIAILASCHGPIKIDYESAAGKIVERCIENSNIYYVISFIPTHFSSKIYGQRITINDKIFDNTVITDFDLSNQFEDSSKVYYFSFYVVKETPITCISSDTNIITKKIDVKECVPIIK